VLAQKVLSQRVDAVGLRAVSRVRQYLTWQAADPLSCRSGAREMRAVAGRARSSNASTHLQGGFVLALLLPYVDVTKSSKARVTGMRVDKDHHDRGGVASNRADVMSL